jgi:hypothetical protein
MLFRLVHNHETVIWMLEVRTDGVSVAVMCYAGSM